MRTALGQNPVRYQNACNRQRKKTRKEKHPRTQWERSSQKGSSNQKYKIYPRYKFRKKRTEKCLLVLAIKGSLENLLKSGFNQVNEKAS